MLTPCSPHVLVTRNVDNECPARGCDPDDEYDRWIKRWLEEHQFRLGLGWLFFAIDSECMERQWVSLVFLFMFLGTHGF